MVAGAAFLGSNSVDIGNTVGSNSESYVNTSNHRKYVPSSDRAHRTGTNVIGTLVGSGIKSGGVHLSQSGGFMGSV